MKVAGTSAPPETAPAASRPGLRELKKQRTRDLLLRSALELFTERGYEETTVDDIAEAADVSQRTFFRYFASKEDAAFFVARLAESHFVRAVLARPPEEAPLDALRRALAESWSTIGEAVEQLVPLELHMRFYRVIESTPALLAAHLRRATELEEEIARVVAVREGLDVDTDPRPRVIVAVFGAVMRVTERIWSARDDASLAALRDLTADYLDQVAPALTGNWRRAET
ncbi:TetR family transcriptional regulator [Streptomyces anthocyanicus]|uniref:Transcriptional regulator n=2 Tax=Streptomyces TaxID=1883 RepID=Q9RDR0_STRCO|nr:MULTISPECIES: TetR family transcriptional regulator [Streptomyces]MCW8119005.1 TetR family transcriptional regulator [Streptomyces anthocyanicus]MCZ4633447.1 TetR family transcriptional regulator [Streptomyces rubrogriseus]MDX2930697.1 TetR family transcriptional regulator [Streptomyces sp. NRRL_B-16638]MDX3346308.1 TetR family transcriptional regulator [Streptomyces sp. ME02-6979A]MDX3404229.1 TetR family transcriptional regulator [Streptomyces sp. ME01-18h]